MATYSMKQLSEKTGVSARTIRYHISKGLLPGAVGKGRRAHYTEDHLERLLEIERRLNAGIALNSLFSTVPVLPQKSTRWTHYKLGPGVVLMVQEDVTETQLRRYTKAFHKDLKRRR